MSGTKRKHKDITGTSACIIAICIATGLSLISSIVGAVFISNEYIQISAVLWWSIFTQLLCSFIGVYSVCKMAKENLLMYAGVVAGVYLLILVFISIMFFNGISEHTLYAVASITLGCACGIVLSRNKNRASIRHRKKRHNR